MMTPNTKFFMGGLCFAFVVSACFLGIALVAVNESGLWHISGWYLAGVVAAWCMLWLAALFLTVLFLVTES